ncbi:MAG: hypothetical protein KTR13_08610 [Saprospiraceae bacterium]|nr:hypothetical protein [Saprospiraceae bacterium]
MKNWKNLWILGLGLITFAACSDSEDVTAEPEAVLSETEALDMVEEAVSFDSGGLMLELSMLSGDVATTLPEAEPTPGLSGMPPSDLCGQSQSKSESGSYEGPNVSWSYQWDWSRVLYCDDAQTPDYFDVDWDASRSYEGPRATSTAVADGDWVVTFDTESSDFFIKIFNGDYLRTIDRALKNRDRSHTGTLDVNIVDVEVRRADQHILSGTLFFTLSGENNTGNTFSRSGEVIFNGDCTATVNMDNGNSRTIIICD